jgi:flagellar protein FliO/FliZ
MSGGLADTSTPVRSRFAFLFARCSCLLWLVLAPLAFAADDNKIIFPKGSTTVPAPGAAAAGSVFNTISLIVAFILAGFGAWLFMRNRRQVTNGRDLSHLAVEETRPLGNRQYLVVASYQDKKFLLGVCPGRIDMLAPLHDEAEKRSP